MLKTRLISAVILLVLLAFLLGMGHSGIWQVALSVLVGLAAWEWARLSGLESQSGRWGYGIALTLFTYWGLVQHVHDSLLVWLLVAWLGVVPILFYQHVRSAGKWRLGQLPLLMLGVVVLFPFAWSLFHGLIRFGTLEVLWWMAMVWAADTGAYFAGRQFGRHKLAQMISPGKTWEGVAGGALAAMSVAGIGGLWFETTWWQVLLLGGIAAVSFVGDLLESLLKRWAGLKDSSHLIPGHGGVLDRIDSLLFALPWMWLVMMGGV